MDKKQQVIGLYTMHIAAILTGMHPQTLRKYEREGFLKPLRHYKARLYSDTDIARLKQIKHLVDDLKLNLAGVNLALKLRDRMFDLKNEVSSLGLNKSLEEYLISSLDSILEILDNPG